MMKHLYNDDTRGFVLNYDQEGNYQDNFTADEVFPVLFDVADPEQRRAILKRLLESGFRDAGRVCERFQRPMRGTFRRLVSDCSAASGRT